MKKLYQITVYYIKLFKLNYIKSDYITLYFDIFYVILYVILYVVLFCSFLFYFILFYSIFYDISYFTILCYIMLNEIMLFLF
jgi:hypothetical protein